MTEINPEEDDRKAGDLSAIAALVNLLEEEKEKLTTQEEKVKRTKEDIRRIEAKELPELMESIGVAEFTTTEGGKVTIKAIIRASLPTLRAIAQQKDRNKQAEMRDRYQRGVAYLMENQAGTLVRNTLVADLGKDSDDLSATAVEILAGVGINAQAEQGVNANSLTAWVKERLEQGLEVDHDLFTVYSGQQAQLKVDKKKKR